MYMLTSDEERIAHEWNKYQNYTIRPLTSTIHFYRHWISKDFHHPPALIYGSTPEIRSLFQTQLYKVILMDKSLEMIRAMGSLTKNQIPISQNETAVIANWLHLESYKAKFDLLIGDDAINMVNWLYFDKFLQNAHTLLNQNGIFICHLLVKPDDVWINQNVDDVINDYQCGKIPSIFDLASRLNFICYEKNEYRMGWQQTIANIQKEKLERLKPDLDFINTFQYCNSQFYCPPQIEFENLVKNYFSIEEIFYPHEHQYCQFEPVYILKKRERNDAKNII